MEKPNRKAMIKSLAISILINGVLPFIIYTLLTTYAHVSDLVALLATGVPSLIDSIVGIIRHRRIDFLAGIVLFGIVVSLIFISLGGSARLYLIRESFLTGAYGVACVVSLFFPKPIGFYTGRYFVAGNDPKRIEGFNAMWQYPQFRTMIRMQTTFWGVGTILEAVLRGYMAFTMPIPQFLAVSPIVNWGIIGAIIVVSIFYMRGWKRKYDGTMGPQEKSEQTA
ncbi:hypothetical protein KSF_110310 [Reticulibacter mediterranei]|uniref:DUF3159 domain-containing protein n=1 Tax=Reticulibacter mediterranei TaxID=2778369 RepID=A0A8J3IUP9_9CHLR|nr:VC0807 family protein [Reticulibacter mediterranei]GHP00984.1 hypothetical protein KSF_110310 [Reticulibacter mediterranei]